MIDWRSHMTGALLITTATAALVLAATPVRAESWQDRLRALELESPQRLGEPNLELAQAAPKRTYAIPAGPLAPALNRFADESGLQIVYGTAVTQGARTGGVSGAYTPEQALRRLLAGTGLGYRFADAKTVTLTTKQAQGGKEGAVQLPTIAVAGTNDRLDRHPGAAETITAEEIETYRPISTEDVLKTVPGIHIADEDGRGLRPNIGIRGLDPFRSRNVLITADGAPIQPAAYGDPAAYYNVPVEDVARIEVIKGGASVLYGPNTVGGVVNYVTRRPPRDREIRIKETVRQGGLFTTHLSAGDTLGASVEDMAGALGILGAYTNVTGSTVRENTDTQVNNGTVRMMFEPARGGNISLRLNAYDEESETPGGLTAAQFQEDPNQSQRSFDVFKGRRFSVDLGVDQPLSDKWNLDSLVYFNWFERNWFIADAPDATATSNSQILRDFFVAGIEPRFERGPLTLGFRAHYEQLEDVRRLGTTPDARSGTTDREAELSTTALAAYATTDLDVTDRLVLTPGIRVEHVMQERKIGLRGGTGGQNGSANTTAVVGGLGARYALNPTVDLYANASRTFQPPTFNEAVDPTTGTANDLASEVGYTYEVGVRGSVTPWANLDVAAFWMDFTNQIISEAGQLRNAQDTRHRGIEAAVDLGPWQGLSANVGLTFLEAEFETGTNEGNTLPMAPEVLASWAIAYERPTGYGIASAQLDGLFVGEQFSDSANTVAESADGTVGLLPSYHVLNLRLSLEQENERWAVYAGVNNLLDREYRVRRDSFFDGIVPGLTRTFYVGASLKF